ncbi:MAG: alkaline phosphatase [Deferribacterales bacterium]
MDQSILNTIMTAEPEECLQLLLKEVWKIFSTPINSATADALTVERDKKAAVLDTLICGAAWELWNIIPHSQLRTSYQLSKFWQHESQGKSVLILDALSLREACWILEQAENRGYSINRSFASFSEIPGDTTPFAKALGYSQRSSLANNGGKSDLFPGAYTESADIPFADCCRLIKPETGIIFWHHWPDSLIHDLSDDGSGAQKITKAAIETFYSDDFWKFIDILATGRKLVITGDHGYANAGLFKDIINKEQIEYMKNLFKSGRSTQTNSDYNNNWVPPLAMDIGDSKLALGRKKWKSQGGYPTLTHGGLSLLEMAVPFIEIEKKQG